MMRVFWEVLKDLWKFVYSEFNSLDNSDYKLIKVDTFNVQLESDKKNPLSVPMVISENKSGDAIGRVAYVQANNSDCYSQPKLSVDIKLGSLLYGEKVIVTRVVNNFAEVLTSKVRGWVDVNALNENTQEVLPNFKSTFIYDAKNDQTIKLRRFIQDEVLGGKLDLPLQSIEFVLSILKQRQTNLVWPNIRPRLPGSWKTILRGFKGVSLSLDPHTGSILEYGGDDGVSGFFGYVEAVHPDFSITLQSVGRVAEGEYLIEEFTHDEWKEWRPVFISFT